MSRKELSKKEMRKKFRVPSVATLLKALDEGNRAHASLGGFTIRLYAEGTRQIITVETQRDRCVFSCDIPIENHALTLGQIVEIACREYEDGEKGMDKCIEMFCQDVNLSDEICEAAQKFGFIQDARNAGIPLSVIEGKTKLTDHFSKAEIAKNCNVEDEGECEHGDVDDFHCLDCGMDLTEDIMSAAYDRAKDLRKYGE